MKQLGRNILFFILSLSILITTVMAEEQKVIVFSDPGWDSVKFHNAVAGYIIDTLYGIPTKTVMGSTPITWQALVDGEIDVQMETWKENILTYEKDKANGKILELGVNFDDNAQGFYVPKYMIQGDEKRGIKPITPNLKTVKDLKEYADVFVVDGKSRLYGAISGWDVNERLLDKYKAYGLDKYYEFFQPGSDAALASSIVAAYEKGEPWVGYYWEPTWISGKYDMVLLEDAPYTQEKYMSGTCAFPANTVIVNARTGFDKDYPKVTEFLSHYSTSSELTAKALAYMESEKCTTEEAAKWFIANQPQLVEKWLGKKDAKIVLDSLKEVTSQENNNTIFSGVVPAIDHFVKNISVKWAGFFGAIQRGVNALVQGVQGLLGFIPWWLGILIILLLGYKATHKIRSALGYGTMTYLIYGFGFWEMMLATLSVVVVAVVISLVIGIPLGIVIAPSKRLNKIFQPLLDGMQTMPAFVYLIPAVMFFGLGMVPATLATTIYALPPIIRLTSLGIQNVDKEMREASKAFGSTRMQTLLKVELPQALPTIMTGVNQTTMMAVAMVVTCSMIGAEGIGIEVLTAINRIEVGRGFVAGIAIVFVAIIIDRILQGFTQTARQKSLRRDN